jgi:hypothetical protein
MEEIGPIVVTFRFCIIMQSRTGPAAFSHAFSGFTFLWQSEWASLAPVCVTPFQYGSQQVCRDVGRIGARGERLVRLSHTGWQFTVTSLFFRGAGA